MKSFARDACMLAAFFALQGVSHADVLTDHPGRWLGDLQIPNGPKLKIGADLFLRADGSPWMSLAVPDQGAYDIPAKGMRDADGTLDIDLPRLKLKLTWASDHFNGQFQEEGGPTLALELRQVERFPMPVRPQTPKGPFPYRNLELAIPSQPGVTLGATLSIPKGAIRPNVVVLVHGSGPSTRDEAFAGHQPFAVLADHLARRGIAVLRYDKRGIARSTGDFDSHTGKDLADDLYAVVQNLKGRKEFRRIGLIGHSEGPGIAAAVAAQHPGDVAFIVSLGGVGLPGLDMMLLQDRATAMANGANPEQAGRLVSHARKYYDLIIAEPDPQPRLVALRALESRRPAEEVALAETYKMNQGSLSLDWADKPFLRAILMADTTRDWRAVKTPVLALNGSIDRQVPAQENLQGIAAALKSGGNRSVEAVELPSLNHLFQTAVSGAEDEYARIDETLAPIALDRIAVFVKKQR